jgi:hypothetical protein
MQELHWDVLQSNSRIRIRNTYNFFIKISVALTACVFLIYNFIVWYNGQILKHNV